MTHTRIPSPARAAALAAVVLLPSVSAQSIPGGPAGAQVGPGAGSGAESGDRPAAPSPTAAPAGRSVLFWADWTGDGLQDAWASNTDGSGVLLENLGNGEFADRTESAGLVGVRGAHQAAWADVDGDGALDLFLTSWTGTSRLFIQGSPGDFVDVTSTSGLEGIAHALDARWFDYDADGINDLHVVTELEERLFHGLGRAQFEPIDLGLLPQGAGPLGAAAQGAGTSLNGVRSAAGGNLAPTPGASAAASSSPAASGGPTGVSAQSIPTQASAGFPGAICAETIRDQATGNCIEATSLPQLGSLFPISQELFVSSGNGFVGIGTTSPSNRLTVAGNVRTTGRIQIQTAGSVPPLDVTSTARVVNLNADLLDGLHASQFLLAGSSINGSFLQNGTITNVKVSDAAAIAGTKIAPDFGGQMVTSDSGADFARQFAVGSAAVRGSLVGLEAEGFLSVSPSDDFDGIPTADLNGLDIGVLGLSTGGSSTDNYGVLGHSNLVGVRGEHHIDRLNNYGELGASGVGVFGRGTSAAGRFEGLVEATHSGQALSITSTSSSTAAASILNSGGSTALELRSANAAQPSSDTVLSVRSESLGRAMLAVQTNPSVGLPALQVESSSSALGNSVAYFRKTSPAALGVCGIFQVSNPTASALALRVENNGTGVGAEIESTGDTALVLDRGDNLGDILRVQNGADVEFRVESSGNVFCDAAFTGGGADYAEWLPRLSATETFSKGDVVGLYAGKISRSVKGADALLVISTNPCLVGNASGAEENTREGHEIVAFMGQVPVRVLGPVKSGDLLVPSGLGDGTARAVSPESLAPEHVASVIGRAWESARGRGEHRVVASIGLGRERVTAIAFEAVRAELDDVQDLLEALAARIDTLESQD